MSSQAIGDTPVTIKVNHNGRMCRFKLPLRDMTAAVLEDRLRACLNINPSVECKFERYSDSASAFVVLDRKNASVYKQLYRAAKAKQRLKIKVTADESAPEAAPEPEPEPANAAEPEPEPERKEEKADEPVAQQIQAPTPSQAPKPVTVEDEAEAPRMAERDIQLPAMHYLDRNPIPLAHDKPWMMGIVPNEHISSPEPQPTPPARPPKEIISQEKIITTTPPTEQVTPRVSFAVCCNNCDATIPEAHYHCGTCDEGDFDLCQSCVDAGITCHGDGHWLIKRFVRGGQIITSQTERISPPPKWSKPKLEEPKVLNEECTPIVAVGTISSPPTKIQPSPPKVAPPKQDTLAPELLCPKCRFASPLCCCQSPRVAPRLVPIFQPPRPQTSAIRTCNCCVQEYNEDKFVHCKECDDYDLCTNCFISDTHGHHPGHEFELAVKGSAVDAVVRTRLSPGRSAFHGAICDGCNKKIKGVRHKCLDCPDWDYCSECVPNANFVHPNHRFVPIYSNIMPNANRTIHIGICCDGPLCNTHCSPKYIIGTRYKCAICDDVDFCGNCEASPANTHNKTHPLIKFKTFVRECKVTTTGTKGNGARFPVMGDRARVSTSSRSTSTTTTAASNNSSTAVQTLVDVKPAEPVVEPKPVSPKKLVPSTPCMAPVAIPKHEELEAVYVRDLVTDGTVLPAGTVFNQTWTLKNAGKVAWPAGCSVKFVGGDYMGHIDPLHPAGVLDLVSANESTVCYQPLEPGKEFSFNVLLRTPPREGRTISYWRLSTPDGNRFGHRLWCDVNVVSLKAKTETPAEVKQESVMGGATPRAEMEAPSESQMIFPKLEKESPASSIHEDAAPAPAPIESEEETGEPEQADEAEDFEELDDDDDDEWDEDDSFNTDDEYDLLDASDEECTESNGKAAKK